MSASDRAELSTLHSQVEELARRCTAVADRYRDTPDTAIAAELDGVERNLTAARRALYRARSMLHD